MKNSGKMMALIVLVTFVSLPLFTIPVKGEEVSYSVRAIIPENQIDPTKSYFDLHVKENETQELDTVIYNNEEEEITVQLSVNPASTNSNGLVIYEELEKYDSSLKIPLSDILSFNQTEITIPAKSSETVTATLQTPEESFDGIILGGLHFEKINEDDEVTTGVNIKNNYAYVIGVQLLQNDKDIAPELDLLEVFPDLTNNRTSIIANVQNSAPVLINDLSLHAKIYKDDDSEPMKEKIQESVNMAPNSHMNMIIDWNNQPLKPGLYTIKLTAEHETNKWEWEDSFEIEREKANEINELAVNVEKDNTTLWFMIGITILAIIILILIIYIMKLKKQKNGSSS